MADNTTPNGSCNCTPGNFSTNCGGNTNFVSTTNTIGYCQTVISDNRCRNCGFVFIAQEKDTHDGFTWCPKCGSNAVNSISYTYYTQPYWYTPINPYPYYFTYTTGTTSGASVYSTTGNLNINGNCEIKSS